MQSKGVHWTFCNILCQKPAYSREHELKARAEWQGAYLLVGQICLLWGGAADPAFKLLLHLFEQVIHTVLEVAVVVGGLGGAAATPKLLQAEGTQVLLRVRVPAPAHFFRYLRGNKGEIILLQLYPQITELA